MDGRMLQFHVLFVGGRGIVKREVKAFSPLA
jgi:hypothetical protein